MVYKRYGEQSSYPFRSGRFVSEHGQWFFYEREGTLNGPYVDRLSAERALAIFLAKQVYSMPHDQRKAVSSIVGLQDNVNDLVSEVLAFFSNQEVSVAKAIACAQKRIVALHADYSDMRAHARINILNHMIDHERGYVVREPEFVLIAL